jgi:uncharacterized membrane protein
MTPMKLHRDESGMIGKIIVIWLVFAVLVGVVVLDAGSIVFTKFKVDDAASIAATTAATAYRNARDVAAACQAGKDAALQEVSDVQFPKNFCQVDTRSGEVTITLKKTAATILAARLSFTKDLTKVVQKETGAPSAL